MSETPAAAPAAPAAPEAPAATPPAAPAASSLIGDDPGDPKPKPAEAPKAQDPAPAAEPAAWNYAENVPGKGDAPEWFRADKYKTVEEQAKAYPELEKRFGAFKGAPKDGKYATPKLPEGVTGEFDTENPLLQEFTKFALDNQVSQDAYDAMLGMLAKYEAGRAPDMGAVRAEIGEDADTRISAVAKWGRANLDADQYGALKSALSGENAASVFKLVETLVGMQRVQVPKPGQDVSTPRGLTEASIKEFQNKKNASGQRLMDIDPAHRVAVEEMWRTFEAQRMGKAA